MQTITPIRYTLDLFCFGLPPETKLCATLEPSDGAEYYMTPSIDRYVENGEVQMGQFLRTLEHYREDVPLCSEAYVSLAYFPDRQQAESTTIIPAGVMKRLAACGVGLEVTTYPHGSARKRYGGACYVILARSANGETDTIKIPPSIRASLRARGLTPTAALNDDITFADQQEFIAHYIPENDGIALFSLSKYLGEFMWPAFRLDKEGVIALAAQGYDIEFHVDFPQRRGLKLRTIAHA